LTFGSVCSGIEAASVAWLPLGWRASFHAEIEAAPSAVLAHHYPGVPNLGDFTRIENPPKPIDVLVGGTPCQSFSVAGKRLGLDDPRGNLAVEYLRLARRLGPRWLVWENVPGVLSSNRGRDFGAFLGLLAELGYGWAYRVLDAQYFGVPQRRRRVFVVGHLGDWRRAAAVLFEREGLCGHPAPRREAGAGVADSLEASLGRRCGQPSCGTRDGQLIADGFRPSVHGGWAEGIGPIMADRGSSTDHIIAHTLRADGFDASEDGTGRGTPLVPVAFGWNKSAAQTMRIDETTDALQASATSNPAVAYQCHGNNVGPMGTMRKGDGGLTSGVPFIVNAAESCAVKDHARRSETARCLDSTGGFASSQGGTVVAQPYNIVGLGQEGRNHAYPTQTSGCLQHKGLAATGNEAGTLIQAASAVRRLTPRECERLQGFPDDYTLVPYRGKPMADGPRYKMLGNSMCTNVMRWIGERIQMVDGMDQKGAGHAL
jgi:DNA (cytosine-5)-methyltransferase 1